MKDDSVQKLQPWESKPTLTHTEWDTGFIIFSSSFEMCWCLYRKRQRVGERVQNTCLNKVRERERERGEQEDPSLPKKQITALFQVTSSNQSHEEL